MSKPLDNRPNAFHSGAGKKAPPSRGVPDLSRYRYQLMVVDKNGNVEGKLYAESREKMLADLDELESRERLNVLEVDPTQHRAAKRGAAVGSVKAAMNRRGS